MKRSIGVLVLTLMLCQGVTAQQSAMVDLSHFDWLVGQWDRVDIEPGQTASERWLSGTEGLKGIGVTVVGGDTVFTERLSIQFRDGILYYIAEVSHNSEPALFRITEMSDTGFVSENPAHDFPKKIEYRREGSRNLTAVISGDGRSMSFSFQKKVP